MAKTTWEELSQLERATDEARAIRDWASHYARNCWDKRRKEALDALAAANLAYSKAVNAEKKAFDSWLFD